MLRSRTPAQRAERMARRDDRARVLVAAGLASPPAAPAQRKGIRARRATPRRSSFFAVPDYHAHLAALPCAFGFGLCPGQPIEVHHQREHGGASLRRPDTHAIPACRQCHRARHDGTRQFKGSTQQQRRDIESALIATHQVAWFGCALVEADLPTVRAAVEAGTPTRGLFAAHPITAGTAGPEAM